MTAKQLQPRYPLNPSEMILEVTTSLAGADCGVILSAKTGEFSNFSENHDGFVTSQLFPPGLDYTLHFSLLDEMKLLVSSLIRNHRSHHSEISRRLLVMGMCIWYQLYGKRLKELNKATDDKIRAHDPGILASSSQFTCTIDTGRKPYKTSVKIGAKLHDTICGDAIDCGMELSDFATYCMFLALRQHSGYQNWVPKLDEVLKSVDRQLKNRIEQLEKEARTT